jgi:hypothetical protein
MKALVSFNELSHYGYRVCEVVQDDKIFPVAEKLSWYDCSDDAVADKYYLNPANGKIEKIEG